MPNFSTLRHINPHPFMKSAGFPAAKILIFIHLSKFNTIYVNVDNPVYLKNSVKTFTIS